MRLAHFNGGARAPWYRHAVFTGFNVKSSRICHESLAVIPGDYHGLFRGVLVYVDNFIFYFIRLDSRLEALIVIDVKV